MNPQHNYPLLWFTESQRTATQNESAVEISDIYKSIQKWTTLKFLGFHYFDPFSINNEFISLREIQR